MTAPIRVVNAEKHLVCLGVIANVMHVLERRLRNCDVNPAGATDRSRLGNRYYHQKPASNCLEDSGVF